MQFAEDLLHFLMMNPQICFIVLKTEKEKICPLYNNALHIQPSGVHTLLFDLMRQLTGSLL